MSTRITIKDGQTKRQMIDIPNLENMLEKKTIFLYFIIKLKGS